MERYEFYMKIEKAAVLGLGAIGCTVAPGLQKVLGHENFCVIASGERKQKLEQHGKTINGTNYSFKVSDTKEKDIQDLIIVAVKASGLMSAIQDISSHVGEQTVILSLMNGVTSEEQFAAVYGREKVLYSLTTISSQIRSGEAFYSLEAGCIRFGEADNTVQSDRVQAVAQLFERAGIPYEIPRDMRLALWEKFLFNVSNNTVAAILHARHFYFQKIEAANRARRMVLEEAAAVAEAMQIPVTQELLDGCMFYSDAYPADGYCSMVQDIEAGRKTEKEIFLGDLIRMADSVQVPVPICRFLYQILEAMETAAAAGRKEHIRKTEYK